MPIGEVLRRLSEWWAADRRNRGMDPYFYQYYEHYDVARLVAEAEDYGNRIPLRGRNLSIGCGYGMVDMLMVSMAAESSVLTGLDVNRTKLAGMDRIAKALGMPDVRVIVGNGFSLPFRDASFDTIIILATLSHLRSELPLLKDAQRVLAPGGRIAVIEDANAANPRRYLWCVRMRKDGRWVERPVNPLRVYRELRRLGFTRVTMRPYTYSRGSASSRGRWYSLVERSGPLGLLFAVGFIVVAEGRRP